MYSICYILRVYHNLRCADILARFERWAKIVQPQTIDVEEWRQTQMPPLDVIMVWHTYMLNPECVNILTFMSVALVVESNVMYKVVRGGLCSSTRTEDGEESQRLLLAHNRQ